MTTTTLPIRHPYRPQPVRRPVPRRPEPAPRHAAVRLSRSRPVTAPTTRPSRAVYRRRRAVSALLGAAFVLVGARAADAVVAGAGHHVRATQKVVHYVVRPGDTLWSIAQHLAPGQDPRAVVDLLVQAHGGPTIQPGDTVNWAGT